MNVREYDEADQQSVIALWKECGLVKPQNDPVQDIARKLRVDRDLFLIGLVQGEIVATVMGGYEGHRGWINSLAVKPSSQRNAYGKNLMREIEERIAAKGCPKINLQVRSTNADVVRFYEAIGYETDPVVSLGKRLVVDQ